MKCDRIYLRESEGDTSVYLTTYISEKFFDMEMVPPRDAMLVIPGGAYWMMSAKEGEPVARAFMARGFNAFVLRYSIGSGEHGAKFPRPLVDVSMAIAHIKRHAEEYNINPDRIFVCGFSAGGHLTGSIGTFWHRPMAAFEGMKEGENKPCGVILSYPVTSFMEYAETGSRNNACGTDNPTDEQKKALSLELQVSEDTVPHFVWQTQADDGVKVENSLILVQALVAKKIPTEYHIFPEGPHAMSTATEDVRNFDANSVNPHIAHWVELAYEWTQTVGKKEKD